MPCGHITTVESFWAYYSHMLKPSDLPANMDVCFFKEGCQPLSDDLPNVGGGKWTARLRKGLTARVWEDLLLAIVGGAWEVHTLLQGAMVSVRAEEDVLGIWSEHKDRAATLQLRQVACPSARLSRAATPREPVASARARASGQDSEARFRRVHCATCEQVLLKILNLPKSAMLEYKRHGTYATPSQDALKYPIASMLQVGR